MVDALAVLERRGYFYNEVERSIELNFLPCLTNAIGNLKQVQNSIIRCLQSAVITYDEKLRVPIEQEIDAKTKQGTATKNIVFRQMLIEDLGSTKIRARPKDKQCEEEDEGHDK
jgi:hypothetical protein